MKQGGRYHVNGSYYSKKELLAKCHMMVHDFRKPDWYRKVFAFIRLYLDPAAGEIRQKSSGTTGDPKEFQLEREAMEVSALKTLDFFGLKEGDRVLLGLPVDYIAGKMMVVRALVGKLDLVLTEPSSRPLKDTEGIFSFVPMVPLQVVESLAAGDELARAGILLMGGGELPAAEREKLKSEIAPDVFESFGMSETYTHFALRQLNGPDVEAPFLLMDGVMINTDPRGCLIVDMPGVTKAPVVTNDLVEISADGKTFTWQGRIDNLINTGGIKLIPEILEERIGKLLGTTVLLLPLPDEKLGQKMVLMVECDLQEKGAPIDRWRAILTAALSAHELPKDFIPVYAIPRNRNFKPDRTAALALLRS